MDEFGPLNRHVGERIILIAEKFYNDFFLYLPLVQIYEYTPYKVKMDAFLGTVQGLSQALTMSLTSTSSDSEQVSLEDFLESCRAPTLLAELDDDEEMGDNEDENDDDENEDDADYEEVNVGFIKYLHIFVEILLT